MAMRKHGWQLPYHPLQVVAVAVFLALGFSFYVFYAPFLGKKMFQYIAIGVYTPLIACVVILYIRCTSADPADTGVFRSKKYLNNQVNENGSRAIDSKLAEDLASRSHPTQSPTFSKKLNGSDTNADVTLNDSISSITEQSPSVGKPCCLLLPFSSCAIMSNCSHSNQEPVKQHLSEDGMFYCSLCEVEVFKYSKHCRVCDKCVDRFDHHCRWLNNCIGKRNYRKFFTLMVFAVLLLVIQWSTGIFLLVRCFLERKRFSVDISAKLGSSFSLVPYVIVVSLCTILAMIATLPLAQLFFFHILLIKKGISTYDYIVALREQEQQGIEGQQSPQMSIVSSITGLSSASSFNTFYRATWCTPPRLFLDDQFDVVPPETGSVSSLGKKTLTEEPVKKKSSAIKISPWTLARLNAEEISRAASEARKKSKILQPIKRQEFTFGLEPENGLETSRSRMASARLENNRRRAISGNKGFSETSTSLGPLQLEARSAFQTNGEMSSSAGIVSSSPDSSLDSPDIVHPFQVSSSVVNDSRQLTGIMGSGVVVAQTGISLSRSTSDGYEPSGGEDSDQVPSRPAAQRSANWGD